MLSEDETKTGVDRIRAVLGEERLEAIRSYARSQGARQPGFIVDETIRILVESSDRQGALTLDTLLSQSPDDLQGLVETATKGTVIRLTTQDRYEGRE